MRTLKSCAVFLALATGVVLCLWAGVTSSATFHVSPSGSNTPPYDTYAKAAHEVADAILAASGSGGTVLMHTGTYTADTTLHLPSGLVWAGVGRDSVTINWGDTEYRPGKLAYVVGRNEIYGIDFYYPMGSLFTTSVNAVYA